MKPLLLSASLAVVMAFGPANVSLAADMETIVIGTDVDAGTLDPRLTRDTTAQRTANLIYSGLVDLSSSLEPQPELAESWESPDPTTIIFKLRPDLTFSDGSPLTADDVVYTFETILDPDFNAPQRTLYTPIEMVEAIDPQTVKFTLSAPYAPLLSYLDMGIVSKAAVEGGRDLATDPLGAGPMTLSAWNRGSNIELAVNENYWGAAPKVEDATIQIIADNTSRAQALEAGDLDAIQSPLSPQDIKRLESDDRFDNAIMPGLGVTYLNFNVSDPLLSDPEMRQALAMLVDQDTIVNQIYQGVDEVATSVLMPTSWAYTPDVTQPGFDLEGAIAKLNDMGWSDTDGDGILDKDGKPLTVMLSTHSEDPNRIQSVEFIQAMMQQAGVNAEVKISDWPTFSTNYVQKGEHQIALLGWLNIVDPDRLLFAQLTTGGSTNWGGYSNPDVDAALKEGRSSLDQAERTAAYQKAAAILAEDLPYYIISDQGYQLFYAQDIPFEVVASPRGTFRGLIGLGQ
ncbi:UNVERIFIED_ORG: peptide/nickel transport system substrate-binding protein [Martelella mediterranea]